jgi:hypothetical protein
MEQHLIVYTTYLTNARKGQCLKKFIHLFQIKDGSTQSMYDDVRTLLVEIELYDDVRTLLVESCITPNSFNRI